MQTLIQELKLRAVELGFNRVGLIPANPAKRLAEYLQWINSGYHGEMAYMARPDRVIRRQDPRIILPGLQTIICVGLEYSTRSVPLNIANDPSRGRISNYAWGGDYHEIMIPRLEQLADWLSSRHTEVRSRTYVDTGAILERDHAAEAGLGFIGKNTMLISSRRGSWLFLGELLTTLRLRDESPLDFAPSCGRCNRCLRYCPTQAFPAPYLLDATRCISYLTIEQKEWIPAELRPLMANWIFGCDICQDVCPFNRFSQPTIEKAFWPENWENVAPPLIHLLALSEEDFNRRFAGSPIKRIRRQRFVRNVCIAAGNWGSSSAVPYLAALLDDPAPIVRGHAAWALRQIGGREVRQVLDNALVKEQDERVRLEIAGY